MGELTADGPKPAASHRMKTLARWTMAGVALAVLLGGASVWTAYRADMRAAEARLAGRSTVVQSPYGPIEYATRGEGPAVLAIHGSGGGFDQGLEMMGGLAPHGYRLIAPSRFGYLRSGRPANASPEVQADALAWLMGHIGEDKVIVAGGSAGALPALQFAIRHPDRTRAVVLLVPAAYAPGRRPNENAMGGPVGEALVLNLLKSDFLFWAATRLIPDQMTKAILATEPPVVKRASAAEQARVRTILAHILPVSRRTRGLVDDTRWAGAPPRYPLERVSAPLLAISLQDDLYGTYGAAAYTSAQVKHGALVGYPTGGHVWVGRDADVWQAVSEFLHGLTEGERGVAAGE
jgi:pimeloyl-ACP methyl ester carboxylesterase